MKTIDRDLMILIILASMMPLAGCMKKIDKSITVIEIKPKVEVVTQTHDNKDISREIIVEKKKEIPQWGEVVVGTWGKDNNRMACLWNISNEILGDPWLWPELYEWNRDKIKHPDLIYPGQVLRYLMKWRKK